MKPAPKAGGLPIAHTQNEASARSRRDILIGLKAGASNIENQARVLADYGYQLSEEQRGFPVSGRCHIALGCRDIPGSLRRRSPHFSLAAFNILRLRLPETTPMLSFKEPHIW